MLQDLLAQQGPLDLPALQVQLAQRVLLDRRELLVLRVQQALRGRPDQRVLLDQQEALALQVLREQLGQRVQPVRKDRTELPLPY